MHRRQRIPLIQRVSPNTLPQRISQPRSLIQKELGIVRSRQPFQHGPHRRGKSIVNFITTRPECVAARWGQGVDLEHGIVRRNGLKGDVGVPTCRGEARDVGELVGETAALFLFLGGDDADLVAEF